MNGEEIMRDEIDKAKEEIAEELGIDLDDENDRESE